MSEKSLLVAVSFRYYAREVVDIVEGTARKNIPILAITDSQLSPLNKHATCSLVVPGAGTNSAIPWQLPCVWRKA